MRTKIATSIILRLGLGLGAIAVLALDPRSASADSTVTEPTLPVPTITVPVLVTPTLQVPTLQVPTLQVPTLQVPTLQVPTLQVPTLQVPTLVAPVFPVLSVPELPVATLPVSGSTATKAKQKPSGKSTQSSPLQPNVVDPQVLLQTLQGPQEPAIELVAPQEASTEGRLPTRTIATIGGGVALIWFALSLLRRRDDQTSTPSAGTKASA
jgi:hypothetical protein